MVQRLPLPMGPTPKVLFRRTLTRPHTPPDRILAQASTYQAHLQRLSVYTQFRQPKSSPGSFRNVNTDPVSQSASFLDDSTILILESSDGGSRRSSVPHETGFWQQLLDYSSLPAKTNQNLQVSLRQVVIQSIFESVADTWSDYIFYMSKLISGLEEEIYKTPASDYHSWELWPFRNRYYRSRSSSSFIFS